MTRSLRLVSSLLFGAGLLPLLAHAQVPGALSADPSRTPAPASAGAANRRAALSLPFFDDFSTQPEGAPSTQRWEAGGGVLVNNRFVLAPPSRGAATFDGLNAKGLPRGSFFSDTDTLTSQPIDLSGLTAASNVYLSFFWQAGNIVSAPTAASSSRPVFIQLEFLGNGGPPTGALSGPSAARASAPASASFCSRLRTHVFCTRASSSGFTPPATSRTWTTTTPGASTTCAWTATAQPPIPPTATLPPVGRWAACSSATLPCPSGNTTPVRPQQ
ncbi:hypothetical protein [Hymenobacter cellulosilyticus]|uniref:Uncharacterized protein n=1 Tax=Hymenobacter cellulosilyticus TaxID=2932248 RepID=A0A8T9QJB7_9BACT|nr:hypothetical protein [Hymenobacter cellulosilyticus]UOQ74883.1 hypothetical protein MUN79_14055 [Hymenobacter cellulosilyticus]